MLRCCLLIVITARLTAKGSKVTCNTLHPGMVSTEVTRHMSAFMRVGEAMAAPILRLLRKTPPEGAYTQVYAATAPELEGKGGLYLLHCEESPVSAGARDAVAGERLWKLSEKLTGLVH